MRTQLLVCTTAFESHGLRKHPWVGLLALAHNADWKNSFLGLVNQAIRLAASNLALQGGVVDRRPLETL